MPGPRLKTYLGHCEQSNGEITVAAVYAPDKISRQVAKRALGSVMAHQPMGVDSPGIIEAQESSWMAVAIDPYLDTSDAVTVLEWYGTAEYVEDLSRAKVADVLGPTATNQLLGQNLSALRP